MPISEENLARIEKITQSPNYAVAYRDIEFLAGEEMRSLRMELEHAKAEIGLRDANIASTVVVFGSTQLGSPDDVAERLRQAEKLIETHPADGTNGRREREVERLKRIKDLSIYYEKTQEFARIVTEATKDMSPQEYVICTGGGPGIMEAANRGAFDAEGPSIGLNIRLPHEQHPNPYITPNLCFQFHYFAMRKFHFVQRAKALVACPGGFGTLDELFNTLTLRQTGKMQTIPIILLGVDFWHNVVNFQYLADSGVIADRDLDLFHFTDSPQEAWELIRDFHDI